MDEKINDKILEYLQKSGDFLIQECPEVIQQTLKYHYISTIYCIIFAFTIIIVLSFVLYKCYFYPSLNKHGSRELMNDFGCLFPSLGIFYSFLFIVYSIDKMIKITYAPKYFLITLFTK